MSDISEYNILPPVFKTWTDFYKIIITGKPELLTQDKIIYTVKNNSAGRGWNRGYDEYEITIDFIKARLFDENLNNIPTVVQAKEMMDLIKSASCVLSFRKRFEDTAWKIYQLALNIKPVK